MARYSIAGRSTVVGTAARAGVSLFASASVGGTIRQIAIYNTTSTAFAFAVARFTVATNVGAGLTEAEYDEDAPAPSCTGFAGHTGDGTVGQIIEQGTLGAAAGSAVILTFGDKGLTIQPGTANGIGITCPTGTGQIFDYTITWDE
jgi:hypothetical protein